MQNDKITLKDLSIYGSEGQSNIFSLLDHTTSMMGRDMLKKMIQQPPSGFGLLLKTQDVIKFWHKYPDLWTKEISNGTLVMLDKFFESADHQSRPPVGLVLVVGPIFQKLFNKNQYHFTKFSLSHLSDFFKGCNTLVSLLQHSEVPELLASELEKMQAELDHELVDVIIGINANTAYKDLMQVNYLARRELKSMVHRLMLHYSRIDAWRSLAICTHLQNWIFPTLVAGTETCYCTQGLYHPLISTPIAYDITLDRGKNFMILTGANMSGKTTFMRAMGVGAMLAHLGMGVPAQFMKISFMEGVITNMHVEDNILKGESYFFAEVQRMKQTAAKLLQPNTHLVLMDELFKGTNVHDACECTKAVVEGLLKHKEHLMVLSTHLYEVAHQFADDSNISFAYFETLMDDAGSYNFTYTLKQGISNDRIGYKILLKEGVIDLLKS